MLLFLIGLFCLLTRRNVIKQVIGLKIMLQGAMLGLIHAGYLRGDARFAETMVITPGLGWRWHDRHKSW